MVSKIQTIISCETIVRFIFIVLYFYSLCYKVYIMILFIGSVPMQCKFGFVTKRLSLRKRGKVCENGSRAVGNLRMKMKNEVGTLLCFMAININTE